MVASVQMKGVRDQVKQLRAIAARAENPGKVAVKLYNLAEEDFKQRFKSSPSTTSSGEVYGGTRWQRLSEAYLASRPQRKTGKQLLDTKELSKSFRRGQPGNIARVNGNIIEFGSSLPKAEGLNEKRKLVVIHQKLVDDAETILTEYVLGEK